MEDTTSPNIIELDADSTNSPLTSTFEDGHESVTTPEPEEDDGYESFADNDESSASNNSDEEEDDGDDDRSSVASDSSELPSEYIIHDDEALEDYVENAERCSVRLHFLLKQTQGESHYSKLPLEVKSRIAAGALLPKNQVIRLIWNHTTKRWIYRNNDVPFVQWGCGGIMKHVAKEYLDQAPELYGVPYDLLVDYETAEFCFDYNRCGSRAEDDDEYLQAMGDAAEFVRNHNSKPQNPEIRALNLSWCPRHGDPISILQDFADIPGLEKVDLVTHGHYNRGGRADFNLRDEEEEDMRYMVMYKLDHYTFDVKMFNHWGVEIEAEDE